MNKLMLKTFFIFKTFKTSFSSLSKATASNQLLSSIFCHWLCFCFCTFTSTAVYANTHCWNMTTFSPVAHQYNPQCVYLCVCAALHYWATGQHHDEEKQEWERRGWVGAKTNLDSSLMESSSETELKMIVWINFAAVVLSKQEIRVMRS